jgi:hypothetical protein
MAGVATLGHDRQRGAEVDLVAFQFVDLRLVQQHRAGGEVHLARLGTSDQSAGGGNRLCRGWRDQNCKHRAGEDE